MKKILFPLAALAFSLTACNTTPKYTINGTVEGVQDGTIYLLKYEGRTIDTLAKAEIVTGKFKLEGTIDSIETASLTIEGQKGRTPLILENAQYTATLNPADNNTSKIEGTENQKLFAQFVTISNDLAKQGADLYSEYTVAVQAKDTAKIRQIQEKYDEIEALANSQEDALVKANPDSYVSAYALSTKMSGMDVEELTAKFDILGTNAKATAPGQKIAARLAKLAAVAIGQTAPDFTMNTPEGQPLSLYDIKGKAKIVDFWASWCGPCRAANPEVVEIYEEFHPKGLEILGVSLDRDKDAWTKAIEDDKLTWNHVSDLQYWNNAAAQLYSVNSIPHLLLLDENNKIVARNIHGEELKNKIAELLK